MRILLLLAALLLAGCLDRADEPTIPTLPVTPDGPLAIETLGAGQQSGLREPARRVVTDAETFVQLWNATREDETQAPPDVDFTESTVIAAFLGQKPSSCWGVRITNATATGGIASVEVTTYTPPPGLACAAVVTYPWHVAALDEPFLQVDWVEVESASSP